jgi:hypothetical protein
VEAFDPLLFAALCSSDLAAAAKRIGLFKKLLGPMALKWVEQKEGEHKGAASIEIEWLHKTVDPPVVLVAAELVFIVRVARLATRAPIRPLQVTTMKPPQQSKAYKEYFGVPIEQGPRHCVTFQAEDAKRPFLTAQREDVELL